MSSSNGTPVTDMEARIRYGGKHLLVKARFDIAGPSYGITIESFQGDAAPFTVFHTVAETSQDADRRFRSAFAAATQMTGLGQETS